MGFSNGSYAKVWEVVEVLEKRAKLRISVSKKNKMTDKYETKFSGFVNVYGGALMDKVKQLNEGDRIKLISVDLENNYDKDKKITYWSPIIFDFETDSSEPKETYATLDEGPEGDEDDDLPF